MNARRTSQLLVLLAAIFGVLAFICACRSAPGSAVFQTAPGSLSQPEAGAPGFPLGPSMEDWMRERGIPFRVWPFISTEEETEFPKLTEP